MLGLYTLFLPRLHHSVSVTCDENEGVAALDGDGNRGVLG